MEYTDSIDRQIAELLTSRHRVMPEHLPGVADDEGAALLEHYAQLHGEAEHVTWDGRRLARERQVTAPAPDANASAAPQEARSAAPTAALPEEPADKMSPVDQVLAAPVEKSLLDSAPSAGVSAWYWLLPLALALPGGIIAWLLVRDTNRTVARAMLIVGIVMTVVSAVAGWSMQGLLAQVGSMAETLR